MTYLFIFLICIMLSAFFSAAEMAFISTNRLKLRELGDGGNRMAGILLDLSDHPQHFLTVLLIGNNIVNITAIATFTYVLEKYLGITNEWVITGILAPILIIFGEMVPKDYGRLLSHDFLLRYAALLRLLERAFHWPASLVLKAIDFMVAPFGSSVHKSIFVDEEEFRSLIEESAKTGVVSSEEKKLIDTILDFGRISVESVMIPADKVAKVALTAKVKESKEIARNARAKMLLVYEEIPSIIVGMIYVFDLLFEENDEQGLKNFLRSPIFLSRNTSVEKAFLILQAKRQSFAVVTDVKGEVVGVVPIERLLVL